MFWWWIFPVFFVLFFVSRALWWGPRWGWGYGYACYGPPTMDPRETLRQRLARGDISVEEYERLVARLA